MAKKTISRFAHALRRNLKMILSTIVLITATTLSTAWFTTSYQKLNGAIQDERMNSMSQIGDLILEKIQLLSDSYMSEVERMRELLELVDVDTFEEAHNIMGGAKDIVLLQEDNTCKLLDGTTIVFSDVPKVLDNLTDEVTSFFSTIQATGEYWIFESSLQNVVLDGISIAGILRLVDSDVYASITTNMIFDNQGTTYVIDERGVIIMRPMNSDGTPNENAYFESYNFLSYLEQSGANAEQISILANAFLEGAKAQVIMLVDNITWLFQVVPEHDGRSILLSVPISITAKETFKYMQFAIIAIIATVIFLVLAFLLWFFYFYRHNAQLELERTKANTKSDFMSKVSHDIRTPLNAIVGMIAIAERSIDDKEGVLACLDSAKKSSEYLISIINDVLDMSRIDSGKMDIIKEPFDLKETLSSVVHINTHTAQLKEISLVLDDETGNELYYVGDSVRIKQCLVNLVSNAIKFTPKGGKVILKCQAQTIDESHQVLTLSVEDNGIGMSEEFLSSVFKPFEQERHSLTTNETVGSGLGLAIVHHLTELMGGQVSVKSQKGEGSIFIITLPLEVQPNLGKIEVDDSPLEEETFLRGLGVLLVEDNELNRSITSFFLQDMGFVVEEAENGAEAVDMFVHSSIGQYQLILMDIQMPVMDGLEAAKAIRLLERPDAVKVPIISLSANAYREDVDKSLAAGMQAHLSKPINPSALKKALLGIIKSSKRED